MVKLTIVASLLLLSALSIRIDPRTNMMIDDSGRTRIFHGMNVVVKGPPYIPITSTFDPQMSLNQQDIQDLQRWGFNIIRMGVMWEAVEYEQGKYNYTYLDQMEQLINDLGAQGIYSIVDAHQDLFANRMCGEGVPNFYAQGVSEECGQTWLGKFYHMIGYCKGIKEYGIQFDSNGNPIIKDCLKNVFALYYWGPESMEAFERLYKNINGLQDAFLSFWEVVSKKFAKNPYVLGYDLINEPAAANYINELKVMKPGYVDKEYLQPMYERAHQTIRKNDDEKIIFFEPVTIPNVMPVMGGKVFSTGFTDTPGGKEYASRVMLNDHSYCCQASQSMCSIGEPPIEQNDLCRKFHESRIGVRSKDAKKYGVGFILTEFGACTNSDNCAQEITNVADVCDEYLVSWAYWMFKGYGDFTTTGDTKQGLYDADGNLQTNKLKALSRTYVQAYQGVPLSAQFDRITGNFYTKYLANNSISEPTVIFYNKELHYPDGIELKINSPKDLNYEFEDDGVFVKVLFKGDVVSSVPVEVIIMRK